MKTCPYCGKDLTRRRWLVEYKLAYDGGGSEWEKRYRTLFGAWVAMVWNQYVASWGGTAIIVDTRKELP